ncbi:MAG: FtsX-like permease family protein [Candidatus Baldrarchaeia archaeon]
MIKSHNLRIGISIIIIFFITLTAQLTSAFAYSASMEKSNIIDFEIALKSIDKEAIQQHVKFFTNCGSRVTGYPGFFKAAEYISSKFEEYGVKPYGEEGFFEFFNVTVPFDHGAKIICDGKEIQAFILEPNYVNPSPYSSPPEGDKLVYVGEGNYTSYDGVDVEGKFVLMNFNSRWYFKVAAMYGAKGVIYIGEDYITRAQAFQKTWFSPIYFPRIYVNSEDGNFLKSKCMKEGEIKVYITSNMTWESIKVPNIVGYVKGKGSVANEAIVVAAYYDSYSVVPKLSPGATDSLGISVLLELAKFFAANPPDRSVILVALAGHWQGLWGAREFVDRHFNEIGLIFKCFAAIDLSTDSDKLGVYALGTTYGYMYPATLNTRYSWLVSKFFKEYLPQMQELFGESYASLFIDGIMLTHPEYVMDNPPLLLSQRMFDSEPYTLASYGGAFTYYTVDALRLYQRTPLDTYDKLNFANLWPQVSFIFCTLWGLANEPSIKLHQAPARFGPVDWGYSTLIVQVSEYNATTAFWDPFDVKRRPNSWNHAILFFYVSGLPAGGAAATASVSAQPAVPALPDPRQGALTGFFVFVKPNEHGEVIIKGLKPYSNGLVDVYVINRTNGRIEWATDLGSYQAQPPGRGFIISSAKYRRLISMFPCASIALFSLWSPDDLTTIPNVIVYNHLSHGPMIRQGLWASAGDAIAFIEPDTPAELLVALPNLKFPISVLFNATEEKPDGYGYILEQGQTLKVTNTPYKLLENIFLLNDARIRIAQSHSTMNPSVKLFHEYAAKFFEMANKARDEKKHSLLYGYSFTAWAYEMRSYISMMDLIMQAINTTVFYFLLLLPFAILVERMIFGFHGVKRIIFIILIFAIFLSIFGLFHPGFHLATNVSMVIMAFSMIIVIAPIIAFIFGEVNISLKEMRERSIGVHAVEISRVSALSYAISQGIENMKKRRFRTILTLCSITIVVFALISFTSIAAAPIPRQQERKGYVPYNGILIRKIPWLGIPEEMYYQIRSVYKDIGVIAPRGWYLYPSGGAGRPYGHIIFSPKLATQISALLFLSPQEANVTHVDKTLVQGRWFIDSDLYSCIITNNTAANLEKDLGRPIKIGSTIPLWGMNLRIVGIVNGEAFTNLMDLDQEQITPRQPTVGIGAQAEATPPHFDSDQIIILPYKLGFYIFDIVMSGTFIPAAFPISIAIKPFDSQIIQDIAGKLALRMNLDATYGIQKEGNEGIISVIRPRMWFSVTGLETFSIPLVISTFTILNMMLGSLYERKREIGIYMSIGLSPLHVAGMFMAESLTYAVLSCVLGYLVGLTGCFIFTNLNLYPPNFYPNYASIFVMIVFGISLGIILLSAAYPARMASRLVTPSLERKWRLTPPKGDEWEIRLPFSFTKEELSSLFFFIREFLVMHKSERVGLFTVQDLASNIEDFRLSATVRLAPYDLGLVQRVVIMAVPTEKKGNFTFLISAERISGVRDSWIKSNRSFIDALRKQLLLWRGLPPSQKERYLQMANRELEEDNPS